MEILTLYYSSGRKLEVAVSDWYCKPAILRGLAQRFGALFITTAKYGCRQFKAGWSSFYPIHNIEFIDYKEHLPWIVIEFNSFARPGYDACFLKRLLDYYEDCIND